MKRLIFFLTLLCLTPFFVGSLSSAIADDDITADHKFFWDEDHEWDPKENRGNYRFYTINGQVYSIRGKDFHGLDLYKFNHEEGQFSFTHQVYGLDFPHFTSPEFDPLLFQYEGEYYAFYYFFRKYRDPDLGDINYGRRFLQAHAEKLDDWKVHSVTDEKDKTYKVYRDVCSIGGYLYFIYDSIVEDEILKYYQHYIVVDKAVIDSSHNLKVLDTYYLEGAIDKTSQHPCAATWFTHPDKNPRILISYSAENTEDKANKGGGVVVFSPEDPYNFHHLYTSNDYAFSVRAMHGSLQGERNHPSGSKDDRNRIQVIYNHFTDGHTVWDGIHSHWVGDRGHFHYRTYVVGENSYYEIEKGEIKLGDEDRYPDEWNRMNLDLAYQLHLEKEEDPHIDHSYSYKQQLWMFHNDKDGYIRGCGFNSDIWHQIPEAFVETDNLVKTDVYGEDIKSTWVLFGIIEGAPPLAVDWDKWESIYTADIDPTELSYTQGESQTYSTTLKSAASWFVEVEGGEGVKGHTKFSQTFEQEDESRNETSKETELSIVLNRESQGLGVKLYIIPTIKRLAYSTYPWWVSDYTKEEAGNQPISYQFISEGQLIHKEFIDLSDEPFAIDTTTMNQAEMSEWQVDKPGRRRLHDARESAERLSLEWKSPQAGDRLSFETLQEKTLTTTHENEFEASISFEVPEVFKMETGGAFQWSNSYTVETTLSKELKFSYEKVTVKENGLLVSGLDVTAYWFHEDIEDLWYKEFIEDGQNPWYIGYIVDKVYPYGSENEVSLPFLPESSWKNSILNEMLR